MERTELFNLMGELKLYGTPPRGGGRSEIR